MKLVVAFLDSPMELLPGSSLVGGSLSVWWERCDGASGLLPWSCDIEMNKLPSDPRSAHGG